MKNWKMVVTLSLGIVFLAASIFVCLGWINNIDTSKQWYSDVIQNHKVSENNETTEKTKDKFTEKDKPKEKEKPYSGPMPWLDWMSVDVSTISTFIPFFGFLLISIGFFRTLIENIYQKKHIVSDHFPFSKNYSRVMVVLGLAGTFWGIIMIGYYPAEKIDMHRLILCLHTALYSTLVAVLWVFLFAQPISDAMQWWNGKVNGIETTGDVDITDIFKILAATVSSLSKDCKNASVEIKALKDEASNAKTELKTSATSFESFRKETLTAYQSINKTLQATLEALQKESEAREKATKEEQKLLRQLCDKSDQRALKAEQERDKALGLVKKLRDLISKP